MAFSIKRLCKRYFSSLNNTTVIACVAAVVLLGIINAFCAIDGEIYRKIEKPDAYIGAFFTIILFLGYYFLLGASIGAVLCQDLCERLKLVLLILALVLMNFVWMSLVFSSCHFFLGFLIKAAELADCVFLAFLFKPKSSLLTTVFFLCSAWLAYWVYISFSFILLN